MEAIPENISEIITKAIRETISKANPQHRTKTVIEAIPKSFPEALSKTILKVAGEVISEAIHITWWRRQYERRYSQSRFCARLSRLLLV